MVILGAAGAGGEGGALTGAVSAPSDATGAAISKARHAVRASHGRRDDHNQEGRRRSLGKLAEKTG